MGHLLTTFFWSTSAFSGTGQLNEGPFNLGTANKLFRAQVRGEINYQGVAIGGGGVEANYPVFGLQQVLTGSSANDVITSVDNDTWLIRRQTGSNDHRAAWAPNTSTGALLGSDTVADDWRGQLAIGANIDFYLSIKSSTGAALGNLNTFGTIRIWWA